MKYCRMRSRNPIKSKAITELFSRLKNDLIDDCGELVFIFESGLNYKMRDESDLRIVIARMEIAHLHLRLAQVSLSLAMTWLCLELQNHTCDQRDLTEMIGKDIVDASIFNGGDKLHPR